MGHSSTLEPKLRETFAPLSLEILDESHRHAGHVQRHGHAEVYDGTNETHLRIRIVSEAFAGMSRLERHRAINAVAADSLAAGLHALAIEAKTPREAGIA